MHPKLCFLLCTVSLAIIFLFVHLPPAQAQQAAPATPAFSFSDSTALNLSSQEPVSTQIISNTAKPLQVTIQLVDTGSNPDSLWAAVRVKADKEELKSGASTVELKAGSVLNLTLTPGENLKSGIYKGYLAVFENTSNLVIRQDVTLETNKETATSVNSKKPPAFAVTTWTIHAYQSRPGSSSFSYDNNYLPLSPGVNPAKTNLTNEQGAPKDQYLTHLVSESGDLVGIKWDGQSPDACCNIKEMGLKFDGLNNPGIYQGTLKKGKDAADNDVTVKLIVAHHIFWPILAVLCGIGLAHFFKQYYIDVYRPVLELNERTAQLEVDFNRAQSKFKEISKDQYAGYNLAPDLKAQVKKLSDTIHSLNTSLSKLDQNNTQYQAVVTRLADLEAQVAAWSIFANKLNALKDAYDETENASDEWPQPPLNPIPAAPAIILKADRLLKAKVETFSEFKPLPQSLDETTALLTNWSSHYQIAQEFWQTIDALNQTNVLSSLNDEEKLQLGEARKSLFDLIYTLWKEDDYTEEAIEEGLKATDKVLSQLRGYLTPANNKAGIAGISYLSVLLTRRLAVKKAASSSPETRRNAFRWQRILLDLALVVISIVIALNTYLKASYFDQPFGTWRNYVDAVLWGFGTQAAVTAITAAVYLLWNSRASLRLK